MGLFDQPNAEHTKEQKKKVILSELGGATLGAGLGSLGVKIGDVHYQSQALKNGLKLTRAKEIAAKDWKTLFALSNGNLTLEDLPFENRKFFKQQLEENGEQLNYFKQHPRDALQGMKELQKGKVQRLFPNQAEPSKLKSLLQSFQKQKVVLGKNVEPLFTGAQESKMLYPHNITNPALRSLPVLTGLAGLYGAGAIARRHFDKENEKHQEEHDLDRLQKLLKALKAKESQ